MTARRRRRKAPRLRVSVTDARGRPLGAGGLVRWLEQAAPAGARGSVSIAIMSDAAMRRLNRMFRRVDHATDVLSFPSAPATRPSTSLGTPRATSRGATRHPSLGDLAIAAGVARRQARELGHSVAAELRILALHGLLHLLGYDHETDRGEMRRLEERLRRRAGLPVGLIARVPAHSRRP